MGLFLNLLDDGGDALFLLMINYSKMNYIIIRVVMVEFCSHLDPFLPKKIKNYFILLFFSFCYKEETRIILQNLMVFIVQRMAIGLKKF